MPSDFLTESEKKVLELENRRKIYGLVSHYAGSHFREIERKAGLSTGVVQHHLNYLVRHELIDEQKQDYHVRYFPKNISPDSKDLLTLLRQKSIRRILLSLLTSEKSDHEQMVRFVRISASTLTWHLQKLEQAKVISSFKQGRRTRYNLLVDKAALTNLFIVYKESFLDTIVHNALDMWEV